MGKLFSRNVTAEVRQWVPEPPIPPYPVAGYTNSFLDGSGEGSLAIPAVWSCVALISNSVSIMPCFALQDDSNGIAMRMDTQPNLLTKPYPFTTLSEWVHMIMLSLLLRGNAFGIVTRTANGYPVEILLLNPDKVQLRKGPPGSSFITYRVSNDSGAYADYTPYGSGGSNAAMWHVRGMTMPGSASGLSPITYAAMTLGVDLKSRKFADDYFGDTQIPKAVLTTDQPVDQSQAEIIKQRVTSAMTGRKPLVLGQGVQFQALTIKPEESQFLATQMFSIAQVCRFYLVPPEMVGGEAGHSMTYSNREQRSLDFLTYCVQFWLKRLEDSLGLIMPDPVMVQFDTNALLRTDAETTAAVHIQNIAAKVKTPTEVRAEMGMPAMTQEQKDEVNLVPLVTNVIGGSKLGVKVNTSAEAALSPTAANYVDTGKPAVSKMPKDK